eukprot:14200988-Heterocapsa_arctica.AAC.1
MEALQAYCSALDSLIQRSPEQPSLDHLCNEFFAQFRKVDAITPDIDVTVGSGPPLTGRLIDGA